MPRRAHPVRSLTARLWWIWSLLRRTSQAWNNHEATRFGASLAFYTILSLAPLVILAVALAAIFVGLPAAQGAVLTQFRDLIGAAGANAVKSMILNARNLHTGSLASLIALGTLLFGASQVFVELQAALNRICDADTIADNELIGLIRRRFFSFGLVLAIGLLLLVSLLVSAALGAIASFLDGTLSLPEWVLRAFDFLVSVAGTSALFALMFRYIPDAKVPWRDAWIGGVVTAGLFSLGKSLIGLYLGKASIGSAYGAAGSLVAIVVWVYYSSQIFLFGAELTHELGQDAPH